MIPSCISHNLWQQKKFCLRNTLSKKYQCHYNAVSDLGGLNLLNAVARAKMVPTSRELCAHACKLHFGPDFVLPQFNAALQPQLLTGHKRYRGKPRWVINKTKGVLDFEPVLVTPEF